jgi:hypothetical protein
MTAIPVAYGFSGKQGAAIVPWSKARRQAMASRYGAESQRRYRAHEAGIAAENPRATGMDPARRCPGDNSQQEIRS